MSGTTDFGKITRGTFESTEPSALTSVVVEAVADHKAVDELDSDFLLYEEIDIESLTALLCTRSPRNLQIQFQVTNVVVRVKQETETEFSTTVKDSERKCRE